MGGRLELLEGDCRAVLPTLEAGSVQCCVTSPPYLGLRDYGTGRWEGGDAGCDHKQTDEEVHRRHFANSTLEGGIKTQRECANSRYVCNCGARRIDSQLGLEATPEEYIAKMVEVFREVWRVLKDDGTLWVNMGDSYSCAPAGNKGKCEGISSKASEEGAKDKRASRRGSRLGIKPKDLCMMPARVAMALQADGWYLRSDIIWAKPNPMPESVTDRPTKSHEYIFLLSKRQRYFYDADAIREPDAGTDHARNVVEKIDTSNGFLSAHSKIRTAEGRNGKGRNKRTVWTVATQPYPESHFATFPEDLIKPCILAGSRLGDMVLDPFAGSGTTGQVALELGRSAILIELSPQYAEMARARTNVTPGFL